MTNVVAKGNYFAMNSNDMNIDGLKLVGNYPFDGSKNLEIRNSRLMSKDAFWNAENIVSVPYSCSSHLKEITVLYIDIVAVPEWIFPLKAAVYKLYITALL